MKEFETKIAYCNKELTPREKLMLMDTSNAIKLDEATKDGNKLTISPATIAVLEIHNERAKDDTDYNNYIIIDDNGDKYVTGSESFWRSLEEIDNIMSETDEHYEIEVYTLPSKNYTGKSFITCSIV